MEPYPDPPAETSQLRAPQIPPNDAEAEQAVLSSMLFDREAIAAACETIRGEDFYRPDNQEIFNAMVELFTKSIPVDAVTLNDKLSEMGILDQIGGRERIVGLAAAYYTSANIRQYTRIVSEKATLRRLISAAGGITAACFDAREEVGVILEHAEKSIFDISQQKNTRDFFHIKDVVKDTVDHITLLSKTKGYVTGIPTGFVDFDRRTAGLQNSDLILIGSRPSMGKTAFMLNIAQHAAFRQNITTAFFSLEMSKEQLVNRMISAEANIDAQRLRTGDVNERDWMDIAGCVTTMSNSPLFLDDTPGISSIEMRAKCRRLKIEKNLGLVVVDYLQLMSGQSSRFESRQIEISEISRSLKALAKELNIPVLTAAQLSRACEARTNKRPILSDLRESGAIEQDADIVAFLYRDEYYNPSTIKPGQAEVIIAKQRNGPTGTVELSYVGKYTKFKDIFREEAAG